MIKRRRRLYSPICQAWIATILLAQGVTAAPATTSDREIVFPVADTHEFRESAARTRNQWQAIEHEHGHIVDLGTVKLQYLEWGDSTGIPLIWSAGFTSSAFDMLVLGPQLAASGYHVISISHRAHGATQVANTDFTLYSLADDIAALMDHLKISRAVIGGTSFGGWITSAFYDSHRERVSALVLGAGGSYQWQSRLEELYPKFHAANPDLRGPILPAWKFDDPTQALRALLNDLLPDLGNRTTETYLPLFWSMIKKDSDGKYIRATPIESLGAVYPDWIDPAAGLRLPPIQRSIRAINPETIYRNLSVPLLIIQPKGHEVSSVETRANLWLEKCYPGLVNYVVYPDTEHAFSKIHPDWVLRDMVALRARINAQTTNAPPRMSECLRTN